VQPGRNGDPLQKYGMDIRVVVGKIRVHCIVDPQVDALLPENQKKIGHGKHDKAKKKNKSIEKEGKRNETTQAGGKRRRSSPHNAMVDSAEKDISACHASGVQTNHNKKRTKEQQIQIQSSSSSSCSLTTTKDTSSAEERSTFPSSLTASPSILRLDVDYLSRFFIHKMHQILPKDVCARIEQNDFIGRLYKRSMLHELPQTQNKPAEEEEEKKVFNVMAETPNKSHITGECGEKEQKENVSDHFSRERESDKDKGATYKTSHFNTEKNNFERESNDERELLLISVTVQADDVSQEEWAKVGTETTNQEDDEEKKEREEGGKDPKNRSSKYGKTNAVGTVRVFPHTRFWIELLSDNAAFYFEPFDNEKWNWSRSAGVWGTMCIEKEKTLSIANAMERLYERLDVTTKKKIRAGTNREGIPHRFSIFFPQKTEDSNDKKFDPPVNLVIYDNNSQETVTPHHDSHVSSHLSAFTVWNENDEHEETNRQPQHTLGDEKSVDRNDTNESCGELFPRDHRNQPPSPNSHSSGDNINDDDEDNDYEDDDHEDGQSEEEEEEEEEDDKKEDDDNDDDED
jgi:hypothetical protein